QYTLEDFTGKSIEDIRNYFSKYNFEIYESAYPGAELKVVDMEADGNFAPKAGVINLIREYTDDYEPGICYSQSLAAGELCNGSEELTFAVSCGKASDYEVAIPDFTGKGKKKAKKALEEAGLADYLELQFEDGSYSDTVEQGKVAEQSLLPGTVYNKLEKKSYQYADGVRAGEQSDNILTLWLSAGSAPVRRTGRGTSSGGSGNTWDIE
ncbi:MAG: PASTA domain-containing protein, partial [Lachnospiraceae bacterium]|nr:PASTA domain-containing protein [Lachnospiraceae bacterium]